MVNRGTPSRGCAVCRQRKIKCDERLPGCSYCFKKQVICPGYKPQFDLVWRDQNVVAEQSVRRRKNAEEKAYAQRNQSKDLATLNSLPVLSTMSEDFEGYAVNFFFSNYIDLPRDSREQGSFLECLYPVWTNASRTSPLVPAVAAVSSVMLEAWSQIQPDQPLSLSRTSFTKAVESLRRTLQGNNIVGDEILLAALMLHMYDNLSSFFSQSRNVDSPHISGVSALIKNSHKSPFVSDVSRSVLHGASNQIVSKSMGNKKPVPSDIDLWKLDTPKTVGELLDSLNVKVANLQAMAHQLGANAREVDVLELVTQLTKTDHQLLEWAGNVPADWTPCRVSGPNCIPQSVREAGLYEEHCIVYKSVFIANTFLSYCSSRMKLHLATIRCSRRLKHGDDGRSLQAIQELADIICDSVPFYLGDRTYIGRVDDKTAQYPKVPGGTVFNNHLLAAASYGGWIMASRLAELMPPEIPLRHGQRQWIGGQLHRIRKVYGVQPR